jgi:hypothetical protein
MLEVSVNVRWFYLRKVFRVDRVGLSFTENFPQADSMANFGGRLSLGRWSTQDSKVFGEIRDSSFAKSPVKKCECPQQL